MKKRNFRSLLCVVLLLIAVSFTACANDSDALQEQIDTLENELAGLRSAISSLRTDLERAQTDISRARNELQDFLSSLDEAIEDDEQAPPQDTQSVALAITYAGVPNQDMSWPLEYGDLHLGLRMSQSDLGRSRNSLAFNKRKYFYSYLRRKRYISNSNSLDYRLS